MDFQRPQMVTKWKKDPVIQKMVSHFEWYILPVLNPDGYAYTWSKVTGHAK